MPRRPRLFIPNQPQHVVVRGHNREPVLVRQDDFRFLYKCLKSSAIKYGLLIHAWVFMQNHIHLLVTPSDKNSLPKTMQSMGRRYVQYFNKKYYRSGSLWEGRYKCSLVDTDKYLFCCYRYIELNPVRAGIVEQPADYAYSSYHANAFGKRDLILTPHPLFIELLAHGTSSREDVSESEKVDSDTCGVLDRKAYIVLFDEELARETLTVIRRGTSKGIGIGQDDFLLKVARLC